MKHATTILAWVLMVAVFIRAQSASNLLVWDLNDRPPIPLGLLIRDYFSAIEAVLLGGVLWLRRKSPKLAFATWVAAQILLVNFSVLVLLHQKAYDGPRAQRPSAQKTDRP